MTNAIRFGKIETITTDGDVTVISTQTIHDYATTNTKQRFTQSLFADDEKRVIAEALKLIDTLKRDDICEVSFTAAKRNSGSKYKVDVSWMAK